MSLDTLCNLGCIESTGPGEGGACFDVPTAVVCLQIYQLLEQTVRAGWESMQPARPRRCSGCLYLMHLRHSLLRCGGQIAFDTRS